VINLKAIKEAEVIAFPDLGAEAIYKLKVENFPVTVVIDSKGNDLYKIGKEKFKR
jgi:fumarate hydratase subunit beta